MEISLFFALHTYPFPSHFPYKWGNNCCFCLSRNWDNSGAFRGLKVHLLYTIMAQIH